MDDSTRFTWQSVVILVLTALVCIVGLLLYPSTASGGDAVRGILASVLAAVASLLLFYYVDPRMKRSDQSLVLRSSGFSRVATNRELAADFWVRLLKELASTEDEAFIVGKCLSEWRQTPTYSHPLRKALESRAFACTRMHER